MVSRDWRERRQRDPSKIEVTIRARKNLDFIKKVALDPQIEIDRLRAGIERIRRHAAPEWPTVVDLCTKLLAGEEIT